MTDTSPAPLSRDDASAVHQLMDRAAAHYRVALKTTPAAVSYLASRGISGRIAGRYGLGYARDSWADLVDVFGDCTPEMQAASGLVATSEAAGGRVYDRFRDRIMFPIRDSEGNVVGFGGRVLAGSDVTPKYLNSPEGPIFRKRSLLYGLFEAQPVIEATNTVTVVEGYLDVLTLAQHGYTSAVATLGTACTFEQTFNLNTIARDVVFCFDGDDAGRLAAQRALTTVLPIAGEGDFRFAFLPAGTDPDSFVREQGIVAFRKVIAEATPLGTFLLQTITTGCDLKVLEGRAKCAHNGCKVWHQLPYGAQRDEVLSFCASVLGFDADELRPMWEARTPHPFDAEGEA